MTGAAEAQRKHVAVLQNMQQHQADPEVRTNRFMIHLLESVFCKADMLCFMKVNLLSFPIDTTYSLKRIPLRIKSIGFLDGPPMYHPESLLTSNRAPGHRDPTGTG